MVKMIKLTNTSHKAVYVKRDAIVAVEFADKNRLKPGANVCIGGGAWVAVLESPKEIFKLIDDDIEKEYNTIMEIFGEE